MPARRSGNVKKAGKDKCPPQTEASPPPSPHQPGDESPQVQGSRASTPSNYTSYSPTQSHKKAKTVTDLTVAEEEDMASWLEENELLYNKHINAYKDFRKKDALWESKAATIIYHSFILLFWVGSL